MKFKTLIMVVISVFIAQLLGSIIFLIVSPKQEQDTVVVNDILNYCQNNFENLSGETAYNDYDFTVLDINGNLIFATRDGLSASINSAIKNRDTILDISVFGEVKGKLIIANNYTDIEVRRNIKIIIFLVCMYLVEGSVLLFYILYVNKRVISPFNALKNFSTQISIGNLDMELKMDRRNIFGAFSESFDIMRVELKKAKEAEASASKSKKQLVANLSHDIKTPIASIKAMAEVGACKCAAKYKKSFEMIGQKADQVSALVGNLFSATLEEMNHLSASLSDQQSDILEEMICASDYLMKAEISKVPQMLLCFDRQRLQQVFDNVISNSYKYADSPIFVDFHEHNGFLRVSIKDLCGIKEDGKRLFEKFYRGDNAKDKDGSGLGLYISRYLMHAMEGEIEIDCDENHFTVNIYVKIS